MTLMILGILLFAGVHLIPSLAPGVKAAWLGKFGEGGYKGSFSLLLLLGLGLIIAGWRSTLPEFLYMPPAGLKHPAMGLLFIAFLLMVVSSRNSRLRQWIRNPQLTGVFLWGVAHLLLNGDIRSTVLFSSLSLWALLEIVAINRRDGPWVKPEVPTWGAELVTLVNTAVVVVAVIFLHPYISGMPVA